MVGAVRCIALLLGLVISLSAAPASRATSFSIPAHLPDPPSYAGNPGAGSEGPALDGERVVWIEQRGFGAALVAATGQEQAHDVLPLSPLRAPGLFFQHLSVAAGSGRAFIERVAGACPGSGNTCTGHE